MFFFVSFLKIQLFDYDFWWHLATGKYIVATKSLPQKDPFSYTTGAVTSDRELSLLKGYWLAQVIFYKIFELQDVKGIIILRSLLLTLFLFFIFLTVKKQKVPDLVALIITAVCFFTAKSYAGERPVLFTFFIFSAVFYLLEDFRINRSRKAYLIPALVMVLSNMHLGFTVCIMLITIYLAGEGGQSLFRKDDKEGLFYCLLVIWGLSIIFSLLNPNGVTVLTGLFSIHGDYTKGIIEFMPPFHLFLNKITSFDYSYIAFLLISILSLRYAKQIGLTHMLLLVAFTLMSFVAIRYVIFYMCVSAPILARIGINLKDEKVFKNLFERLHFREIYFNIAACIIGVLLVFNAIPASTRFEIKANTAHYVPKGAADFLSNVEIKGNMFNEYGFGGYLIWRLYPDAKVFIDTRKLEPDTSFIEYQTVVNLTKGLPQSWEDIIKKHNITYIVIPPLMHNGEIFPVVEKMIDSEDWVLIYSDHLSMIFVLNDFQNTDIIKKFAMDKSNGLQTIIIQSSTKAMENKGNPYFLISLGKVFFKMGKFENAEKAFTKAYEISPKNFELKFWMEKLERIKNSEQDEKEIKRPINFAS